MLLLRPSQPQLDNVPQQLRLSRGQNAQGWSAIEGTVGRVDEVAIWGFHPGVRSASDYSQYYYYFPFQRHANGWGDKQHSVEAATRGPEAVGPHRLVRWFEGKGNAASELQISALVSPLTSRWDEDPGVFNWIWRTYAVFHLRHHFPDPGVANERKGSAQNELTGHSRSPAHLSRML